MSSFYDGLSDRFMVFVVNIIKLEKQHQKLKKTHQKHEISKRFALCTLHFEL